MLYNMLCKSLLWGKIASFSEGVPESVSSVFERPKAVSPQFLEASTFPRKKKGFRTLSPPKDSYKMVLSGTTPFLAMQRTPSLT